MNGRRQEVSTGFAASALRQEPMSIVTASSPVPGRGMPVGFRDRLATGTAANGQRGEKRVSISK